MKRVLILEDDSERIEQFRRSLRGCELQITDKPLEAINLLEEKKWDWLFLDHDLGGKMFAPSDENSGYAVATFLEEHPEYKPKHIVLHSMNPEGRKRMQAALPEATQLLCAWLVHTEELEQYFERG